MSRFPHYANITFFALLVSVVILGLTNKDFGVMGIVLVALGWATSQIARNGISSLLFLMTQDEEDKD